MYMNGLVLSVAAMAAALSGCSSSTSRPAVVLTAGNVEVAVEEKAVPVAQFAASELTNFLSRTLGAPVPLVRTINPAKTTVVVGDSAWSRAEGLDVSKLARDGFYCKAAGNRIYLLGQDDVAHDPAKFVASGSGDIYNRKGGTIFFQRSTLFAAYDFLERYADVRFFFPGDLGTVVAAKRAVEVPVGDRVTEPVFTERYYSSHRAIGKWYDPTTDPKKMHRLNNLRLRYGTQRIPCCHGQRQFHYVPRFAKEHPEYFCLQKDGTRYLVDTGTVPHFRNGKLCYSSPVVEELYQDVKAYLTGKPASSRGLKSWGGNCVGGRYVDIMPEDSMMECHCEKCQAAYNKKEPMYATDFIWKLTAGIANRLTAEGVKGDVTQMAYPPYRRVPDFKLPDNVQVMVAENGPWSVSNQKELQKQLDEVKAWSEKLGHKVWVWTYPGKYGNKMPDIPQISPRAYAEFFSKAEPYIMGGYAEIETDRYLYDVLNVYTYAKLAWDPHLDIEALVADWHARLFGRAAKPMQAAFDLLEQLWVYGVSGGKMVDTPLGPVMAPPSTGELWTKIYSPERIAELKRLFAEAAKAVSPDTREGKCVALFTEEVLDPLVRKAEESSVESELKRRAARPARSILKNGELDTLEGWGAGIKDATVTADPTTKVTGAASAKLVTSQTDFGNKARYMRADLSQSFKLEKGRSYRLSYFVKTKDVIAYNRNEGAGLCLWLADGKYIKHPLPLFTGTCDWMHQSMTFTADKDMKARLQFRICESIGTMWIDGVVLEPVD